METKHFSVQKAPKQNPFSDFTSVPAPIYVTYQAGQTCGKIGKIIHGTVACQPKIFLPPLGKIPGTNLKNTVWLKIKPIHPITWASIWKYFLILFLAHFDKVDHIEKEGNIAHIEGEIST